MLVASHDYFTPYCVNVLVPTSITYTTITPNKKPTESQSQVLYITDSLTVWLSLAQCMRHGMFIKQAQVEHF